MASTPPLSDSCLFCRIAVGEIPARKVSETAHFMAFEDINPKAPVHLLVIPKAHVPSFNEIGELDDHMAALNAFIVQLAHQAGVAEKGYRLCTNVGPHSGQEVSHLHWHLLGGRRLRFEV